MALDFTLNSYKLLLEKFQQHNYAIVAYEDFIQKPPSKKLVIMRHDVDKYPDNSYWSAKAEKEIGARATYYFRIVKESNDPETIRAIADLGHEIGYHYEDLTLADGDIKKAIDLFEKHLTRCERRLRRAPRVRRSRSAKRSRSTTPMPGCSASSTTCACGTSPDRPPTLPPAATAR